MDIFALDYPGHEVVDDDGILATVGVWYLPHSQGTHCTGERGNPLHLQDLRSHPFLPSSAAPHPACVPHHRVAALF